MPYRTNAAPERPAPAAEPSPFLPHGVLIRFVCLLLCLIGPVASIAAIGLATVSALQGCIAIYELIAFLWAGANVTFLPDPPYTSWSTGARWLAFAWAPLFMPGRLAFKVGRWVLLGD